MSSTSSRCTSLTLLSLNRAVNQSSKVGVGLFAGLLTNTPIVWFSDDIHDKRRKNRAKTSRLEVLVKTWSLNSFWFLKDLISIGLRQSSQGLFADEKGKGKKSLDRCLAAH